MATVSTIPKQVYVTIQYRKDASEGLLGFLSPYTKDTPFQKRKSTQDSWAYGYGVTVTIDPDDDSISVTGKGTRGGYGRGEEWDATMLFIANCHPRILDNTPVEGFAVASSVRRCGWNGSGNVKWRIADPRGFELEISSDNFMRIIDCSTIENGVIKDKCVWGRLGKDNILLPITSDIYREAEQRTTKINSIVSLKDVQIGDMVDLVNADGVECIAQYLGKYFLLTVETEQDDEQDRYYSSSYRYKLNDKYVERYILKDSKGNYFAKSTPKISSIITKVDTPLDKNVVAQEITDWISDGNEIDDLGYTIGHVIAVLPLKVKSNDISMSLEPINETYEDNRWPIVHKYYPDSIFVKDGNDWYVAAQKDPKIPLMHKVTINIESKTWSIDSTTESVNNNYWYSSRRYNRRIAVTKDNIDVNAADKYRLVIKAGNIIGKVRQFANY